MCSPAGALALVLTAAAAALAALDRRRRFNVQVRCWSRSVLQGGFNSSPHRLSIGPPAAMLVIPATSSRYSSIASSSDGTKLAAVVYNGYIYTSSDSGVSWTQATTAGTRTWKSIASSYDGTKLAAVV